MADEKKPKGRKKLVEPESQSGILDTKAKVIGAVAAKAVPLAGAVEPDPRVSHTKSAKRPKLQKTNKSRLPRRQKKAYQKVAATKSQV